MRWWSILISALLVVLAVRAASAQSDAQMQAFVEKLNFRTGTVYLEEANVTLKLPNGFQFLSLADVLEAFEAGSSESEDLREYSEVGVIFPPGSDIWNASWTIDVSIGQDGYVAPPGGLISAYQLAVRTKATTAAFAQESRAVGGTDFEFINFARVPRLDASSERVTWSERLRYADESAPLIDAYGIALGRQGTLELMVEYATERQLPAVHAAIDKVLAGVSFDSGERYADFSQGDLLAEYDLEGLISGEAWVDTFRWSEFLDHELKVKLGKNKPRVKVKVKWILLGLLLAGVLAYLGKANLGSSASAGKPTRRLGRR